MREPVQNYGYLENFGMGELIAFPIYFILAYFFAYVYKNRRLKTDPHYSYLVVGLTLKVLGALGFCSVYIFLYSGGDTIAYFESARSMANLFLENYNDYFEVLFSKPSSENYNLFSEYTGYPWAYMYFDPKTNFLIKLLSPIVLLCFNSYLLSTVIFSILSYIGIWKAYTIMVHYYPSYYKAIFWCFIGLPTSIFWASGILKDTIILGSVGVFLYCMFRIVEIKSRKPKYFILLLISVIFILKIKSYVLMALIPGCVLWLFGKKILKQNAIVAVILLFISFGAIYGLYMLTGSGAFGTTLDSLLKEASVKQRDLKQAYYEGNSFDIGNYDPTLSGALSVAPKALFAGLFRPTLLDARNVQMILSAIENTVILVLFLIVFIFRIKTVSVMLSRNPFLILCISFSILMGVLIGLSTSNFGALVRFKTVFESYFLSALFLFYMKARVYVTEDKNSTKSNQPTTAPPIVNQLQNSN
jgi:uncharacterized membrane protein YqjE